MNFGAITNFLDKNTGGQFSNVLTKVKGKIMDYTEIQIKVDQATNNDKWGASSTLMQEICDATHDIQQFHEIMDLIYKKFQQKDSNWRQCYKSLQLLEYLIKNGSEKVIDDARDHIYEFKALQKFVYIDEKGKDQGINVQTRAKEIHDLLGNQQRIDDERRKARENKGKYAGFSSDSYKSGGVSSSTYTKPASNPQLSQKSVEEKPASVTQPPAKTANLIDAGADDEWGDFAGPAPTQAVPTTASASQPPQQSGNLIDLL